MPNLDTESLDTNDVKDVDIPNGEEMSFSEEEHNEDTAYAEEYIDKRKKKRKKRLIIFAAVFGGIILAIIILNIVRLVTGGGSKDMYTDAEVERRTIVNSITGSSSIEPNDSYNVISIHSGDITKDYISEGSVVKDGDKLYQFDDEDAQNQLKNARNQLTKAQQAYVDAVKSKAQSVSSNSNSTKSAQNAVTRALTSLNEARDAVNDQNVTSPISGKIKKVLVSRGDSVANGAPIAEVYDDSAMKIRLPFNEFDAGNLYKGAVAEVYVSGSGETLYGTVTSVSTAATSASAHTMVVYATVELTNPGALTTADVGSAVVGGVACADTANFEYVNSRTITAKATGTIEQLYVDDGDAVYAGGRIAYIDSDTVGNSYTNAQLSYDDAVLQLQRQVLNNDTYALDSQIKNAQLSLDDAQLQLKTAQDNVDDYLVEAPISGTVVKKNAKAGDTINSANGNSEALCVIYDLSCVKFSLDVDETEIALVKTGQKVKITADAVDGEFEGEVIKVPVDGVNENGVTTYTIDIQIDDYGDLLPGMNIDAEITVEEAEDVLSVPVNSVNRGNIVFVKDDGKKRDNDITDMLTKGKDAEADKDGNAKKNDNSKGTPEPKEPKAGEAVETKTDEKLPHRPMETKLPLTSAMPMTSAKPMVSAKPKGGIDMANIPMNIEVPEGYRAIVVETGINDSDYIEIKSGLNEGDLVRTLNTESSSQNAMFGGGEAMMMNGGMGGGMNGRPQGGMGGGPSGGMGGR